MDVADLSSVSPESIGAAVVWLVARPEEAAPLREKRIRLPRIARELGFWQAARPHGV